MQFSHFDGSKVVPYQALKPSAQAGCVNVVLPDYTVEEDGKTVVKSQMVLSAHGDARDPGTDGPWEQAQVVGNEATYLADGVFFTYLIVPTDKLPR